jgi:nucleoid-associated protein YgaU
MNDPAVKLALALSILLGGFLAAFALRPDRTVSTSDSPSWAELAAIRNRRQQECTKVAPKEKAPPTVLQPQTANTAARSPTTLEPLNNQPPVPTMTSRYPGDGSQSSSGGGMPLLPVQEGPPTEKGLRIHKIVDGDTLPALAARYLGSPEKAMEIFKANRELLSDPDLLPIGGELKIPQ